MDAPVTRETNTLVIQNPTLLTKLNIIAPKYSTKHKDGQWSVLLATYKVDQATPTILIDFKAKHLSGQRYAIPRQAAMAAPVVSNGKITCYSVNLDDLRRWVSKEEDDMQIREAIVGLGWMDWKDFSHE